ncbi:MAG: SpoIVB peptidase [Alicyclobacillaceae bacterium]|nr:SpoIVB peptidase [Alicyclobacillaceae bacterium]
MAHQRRKWMGLFLATLVVVLCFCPPFYQWLRLPDTVETVVGSSLPVEAGFPARLVASPTGKVTVSGAEGGSGKWELYAREPGQALVHLEVFGLPLRHMRIQVMPEWKVIPGGQSIGVKLRSKGIMVVGYNLVRSGQKQVSPGEQADIKVGDRIVEIDGRPVRTVDEAAQRIREAGEARRDLELTLLRQRQSLRVKVHPVYDEDHHAYRIGLYIRDSAAGVGTLTFFDPEHRVYGALGHVIADVDTGQPIEVGEGQVLHSSIHSIDKGQNGQPGEKRGQMVNEHQILGNVVKNTPFGIFGEMDRLPEHGLYRDPVPVALASQVHPGPAKILTVVEGQKVEAFDVEVVSVMKQRYPAMKGMVLKVTDPRLLQKTGGIVQGMSGSPILQDGRLIGAVTHVFINDPTQGYGVFAEWMMREAVEGLDAFQEAAA